MAQSTQSAGPVRFLIFCSVSIFLLASLVAGRRPQCTVAGNVLYQTYTGILNLLQPAQAEVVLGQLSTYLASWGGGSLSVHWPVSSNLGARIWYISGHGVLGGLPGMVLRRVGHPLNVGKGTKYTFSLIS